MEKYKEFLQDLFGENNSVSVGIFLNSTSTQEQKIHIILSLLGIQTNLLGYRYLKKALINRINSDELSTYNITDIYSTIANEFNTTPSRVERAIRHAISNSMDFVAIKPFTFILGSTNKIPSNKQYINQVVSFYKTFIIA